MNREINFRFWDEKTKRFYYLYLNEIIGLERTISVPKNVIIQQYTGLKDSKGKEIYEGDIMASRGNYYTDSRTKNGKPIDIYCVVVWNKKSSRFGFKPIDEYLEQLKKPINPELDSVWSCDLDGFKEVIGNVFENPKLLHSRKNIDIPENNKYDDGYVTCPSCEEKSWDGRECYECNFQG